MGIVTSTLAYYMKDDIFSQAIPDVKKESNFYGYKKDNYDHRDQEVDLPSNTETLELPEKVDLRQTTRMPSFKDVEQQRNTGTNAIDAALFMLQYNNFNESVPDGEEDTKFESEFTPSQSFVYWNQRYMTNSVMSDSGSSLRNTLKVLCKIGACDKTMMSNDDLEEDEIITKHPSEFCFTLAKFNKISQYKKVPQKLDILKYMVYKCTPVAFGVVLFQSFEDEPDGPYNTGKVLLPDEDLEKTIGSHCVTLVGYDDTSSEFIVRNSMGEEFGGESAGYLRIPYEYVLNTNYCYDFWCIPRDDFTKEVKGSVSAEEEVE